MITDVEVMRRSQSLAQVADALLARGALDPTGQWRKILQIQDVKFVLAFIDFHRLLVVGRPPVTEPPLGDGSPNKGGGGGGVKQGFGSPGGFEKDRSDHGLPPGLQCLQVLKDVGLA